MCNDARSTLRFIFVGQLNGKAFFSFALCSFSYIGPSLTRLHLNALLQRTVAKCPSGCYLSIEIIQILSSTGDSNPGQMVRIE